ncbi:cell wall-binding repeat-containing protein [Clostridium coskatii]|uniref:N-acetylmuramoyl-L-alanine amidase LytC n=1 Tax=Clostridium coskatii TaxID=1705578 RepID=A0A162LAZ4_9CLOT|nr:cell wall-binding repeat-containing protein [Clostridium coskatii]OAA87028.1 N-acetylmuramoyl-L-alanine amidase LytC precursor [Clostridium coskatii]OBR97791.1 N-acetylmuramoyl-L-alanine amidase LytC precursor [Clostridium coskatii]
MEVQIKKVFFISLLCLFTVSILSVFTSASVHAAEETVSGGTPTVTSVSPSIGTALGGTSVTIKGTGFTGTKVVNFGTTEVKSFSVVSDTEIVVTAPIAFFQDRRSTVDITVGYYDSKPATSSNDQFTYVPAPSFTSISPNKGAGSGGTSVTIIGTFFNGATAVNFGDIPATSFSVVSDTEITAIVPAAPVYEPQAGYGIDVRVTTPYGTSPMNFWDVFNYDPAPQPVVVGVSPYNIDIVQGTTKQFSATIVSGAENPQTYQWSVSGDRGGPATSKLSIDQNGLLSVAADTPLGWYQVSALPIGLSGGGGARFRVVSPSGTSPVNKISITPDSANVTKGGTVQLKAAVDVTGGADQTVTWGSEDYTGMVTVDQNGKVTVSSSTPPGDYIIYAKAAADNSKTAFTKITVPPSSGTAAVTLVSPTNVNVPQGGSLQLVAVDGTGASKTVQWRSEDENRKVNVDPIVDENGQPKASPTIKITVDPTAELGDYVILAYSSADNTIGVSRITVTASGASTVTVAEGSVSEATAGDSKITGLTIGSKYKVTVDGAVKYVKADGTLSDNETDAAALTGTEITGLTNGKSYKVEAYVPSQANASVEMDTIVSSGLSNPLGVAVDSTGNVYIADTDNQSIKKLDTSGHITTLVSSELNYPSEVAVDSIGNVYIADTNNNAIKKLDTSGHMTTLVSSGLNRPNGVAVDSAGNVYIADTFNRAIKKLDTSGHMTTLVSSPPGLMFPLMTPCGVAVDSIGNVYIVDRDMMAVDKLDTSGHMTTLVSSGLWVPQEVAVDSTGNLYITDSQLRIIMKVDTSGNTTTLASSVSSGLNAPYGVAVDSTGNLYITDNNTVKKSVLTQNSTINPTIRSFDKNTAKQTDVSTTLSLNGNTLTSITNGATALVKDVDYTTSGSAINISKDYLAKQGTGTTTLTFNFSAGNPQNLAITVTDTTPVINVTVAEGSVSGATAGDSKITGLTIGNKYKVTVDGAVKYVKADGTLSDNESDAAALTGTEITGLTNGKSYKVEAYVPSQASTVTVADGSVSGATAGDSKVTGIAAGNKYKVTVDGVVKYVKADGTLSDNESDAAALTGTEITGLTNGKSYKVEAYVPSQASTVTVADGSVSGAVAGDSKVTGLTIGSKYKVTVDGAVKYVKADGTLSDNESDAAALIGTEITGLTNGKTYKVEAYTPPSGNSFSIQVTGKPVETVNELDVTPNMTGGYHFKLPNETRDALLSDVNSVNTDKVDVTISKGSKSISGEFPKTNITDENLIAGVVLPVTVSSPIIVAGNTITSGNYNVSIKMIPGSTESDFDIAFISKPDSHSGGSSGSSSGGTSDQTTVTGNVVEGNSQSQVSNITASVTTDSSGNKTVSMKASEIAALKAPDGTVSGLTDVSKLSITTDKGTPVTIGTDGTVKIESLAKGTTNNFNLTYDLGNGQKIVIGTMEVNVGTDGKVGLQSKLIDPYGIITDVSTGKPIEGANVTLYYANTDRNKAAGKKADTEVPLPGIDGFKPNNNKNPQVSDSNGAYGFMVFPNSDYYVVVNKDGYYKYVSPTISVEKEIVKWDIRMNKEDASSKVTGVQRLSGQNRIDTALDIAKAAYPGKISNVVIASAQDYPDALSGSVLSYKLNAPMLLVGSTDEDQQKVISYIKSCMDNTGSVYMLGGNGAVSKGFEDKVTANGFKNITRLGGADRYETSEKIAEKLNVNKETPVVIVSGEDYADAASISNIAAVNQYPILLVRKNEISDTIKKEISTINPTKVFIIGLQGSIDTEVENTVAQIIPIEKSNITRIGGSDRYETSLEVGKYFKLDGNEACIASGNNFPDALAGSIYAGKHNAPIVLVNTGLSDNQTSYLKDRKLSGATIFGGEGVVDKNIEQQISQIIGK